MVKQQKINLAELLRYQVMAASLPLEQASMMIMA